MFSRRTILLKPMCAAASGYARVQTENGRAQVQLHARGLPAGKARLFAYLRGQAGRELAAGEVHAQGELSLEGEAPCDVQALLLVGDSPLLIGLCAGQDAGSLLDAKNAALALCERLRRPPAAPPAPKAVQRTSAQPASSRPPAPSVLSREIFLPAIDPAPYQTAALPPVSTPAPMLPPPRPEGPWAHRLRPVRWPLGFETLEALFQKHAPVQLFDAPGWRFVQAAQGLWIGRLVQDGRVVRLAYAYAGRTPPPLEGRYHPVKGTDGEWYQVLWQAL